MSVPAENLDVSREQEAHMNLVDLVESEISPHGYTLGQPIGEGHTRVAYLATYQSGQFRQSRVVKIPKVGVLEASPSICTRINLSKGDLDRREAEDNLGTHFVNPSIHQTYLGLSSKFITSWEKLKQYVESKKRGDEKLDNLSKQYL